MSKKPSYLDIPIKLTPKKGGDFAWAYEDFGGIHIYIETVHGIKTTKVSRRQILAYMKRDAEVRAARKRAAATK